VQVLCISSVIWSVSPGILAPLWTDAVHGSLTRSCIRFNRGLHTGDARLCPDADRRSECLGLP